MPTDTFNNLPPAKRASIEAAAIAEFAANPYPSCSINAIVAASGIAKGSFYQYFQNIEDLYQHILTHVKQVKKELAANLTLPASAMDTFSYLRWMLQVVVIFELREPKLSAIERHHFFQNPTFTTSDPETGETIRGDGRFQALLTQGVLHDDIATWVDTEMAAYLLDLLSYLIAPYMVQRMGVKSAALREGSVDIAYDPLTQDLFDNLFDLVEAGIARDPQIRKDFYTK